MELHHHTLGKIIAWSLITVLFALCFFFVLRQAITTPLSASRNLVFFISKILQPIIIFSGFLGACAIHAMIINIPAFRYGTVALSSLAMLVFFPFTALVALACLAFFGACVIYQLSVRGDTNSRIRVQPIYSIASGLSGVIVVILLSISVLYYVSISQNANNEQQFRNAFRDNIVNSAITVMRTRDKSFSGDMTLDQFVANLIVGNFKLNLPEVFGDTQAPDKAAIDSIRKSIEEQTGKKISDEEINKAIQSGEQKANTQAVQGIVTDQLGIAERQLIEQVRNQIVQSLGIEASGTDTVREVLVKIVDRKVISFVDPYFRFVPLVLTLSLFVVLYVFAFLYRYLTRGFGLLWYGILRALHFIVIREEDVKAQRISLE